jgi:F5/8 type C domain
MTHGKWTIALCTVFCSVLLFGNAVHAQSDVSLDKPAYVSSWDTTSIGANGKGMPGSLANDGDPGTRWATDWMHDVNKDSGWIYFDLGAQCSVDSVVIIWETAGALHYAIQVANVTNTDSLAKQDTLATDAPWTTVAEITDGVSGETRLIGFAPAEAMQVRVRAYSRTTTFGYSIWDFHCYSPTLAAKAFSAKKALKTRTQITAAAIRFFAPDITGCKLYDIKGRLLLDVNQPAGPSLSIGAGFTHNAVIARLETKSGISTHRLLLAR